jgi:hemoglobin
MRSSPFDRCGGFAGIRHIVSALYDRMLDTPSLSRHFAGVDMPALIDHQTKFMAMVTGGPAKVTEEALRRAHARLGITAAELAETGRLLQETLQDFGVAPTDIATIMTEVEKRAPLVVREG